jgi:hypothetical protein
MIILFCKDCGTDTGVRINYVRPLIRCLRCAVRATASQQIDSQGETK